MEGRGAAGDVEGVKFGASTPGACASGACLSAHTWTCMRAMCGCSVFWCVL